MPTPKKYATINLVKPELLMFCKCFLEPLKSDDHALLKSFLIEETGFLDFSTRECRSRITGTVLGYSRDIFVESYLCILILHVAWYWISSGLRFVDIRACLISLVC